MREGTCGRRACPDYSGIPLYVRSTCALYTVELIKVQLLVDRIWRSFAHTCSAHLAQDDGVFYIIINSHHWPGCSFDVVNDVLLMYLIFPVFNRLQKPFFLKLQGDLTHSGAGFLPVTCGPASV
ncbi:MAG TPA: hypothetical protein VGK59_16130 [Ohtaekwangia sp.]